MATTGELCYALFLHNDCPNSPSVTFIPCYAMLIEFNDLNLMILTSNDGRLFPSLCFGLVCGAMCLVYLERRWLKIDVPSNETQVNRPYKYPPFSLFFFVTSLCLSCSHFVFMSVFHLLHNS